MPDDIKIKDLGTALQIADNAEFVYTQDNGGSNTTYKAQASQLGSKINEGLTFSNLLTTDKHIVNAINEVRGIWFTSTLSASATSVTIQDQSITTSSTVYAVLTNTFGVNPTNIEVTTGQIVLTFPAQQSSVGVKVQVL